MYLKQIDIHGFKSFADKTTVTFLPPKDGLQSVTGIVGPNGSGKSNVSDAIRWVMGEQKMTNLRGKKSQDIIFSGSVGKGKMGMASVMMTLDNSDKRIDLDYEEVVIGRRIYRSGESEYVINGNTVRLLDLQLLLAKAQFGQGSYAIIGQGMIDRLLLQSATERKAFFDEASGIKEFQIKRHRAALRLARTREHIEQAEMLLTEIAPRLKTLSRQVQKLEERKELEKSVREKQEQYYVTLWKEYEQKHKGYSSALKEINDALDVSQKQLTTIQEELAGLARQASRQEAFAELQQAYQEIQQKKNALEREQAILQGKLQSEYRQQGNHQVGWLEEKVTQLKAQQQQETAEITRLEQEQANHTTASASAMAERDSLFTKRSVTLAEIRQKEQLLDQLKQQQTVSHVTGLRAVQAVLEARYELGDIYGAVAQLADVPEKYQLALDVAAGGNLSSLVVADEDVARAAVAFLRAHQLGYATFLPMTKLRVRDIPPFIQALRERAGVYGLAVDLLQTDARFDDVFSFVFGSTLVVEDFQTAKSIGIGRARMVTLDGDLFETSGAIKGGYRKRNRHGFSFSNKRLSAQSVEAMQEVEDSLTQKQDELRDIDQAMQSAVMRAQEAQRQADVLQSTLSLRLEQKHRIDQELASLEQELALATMSPEQYGDIMKGIAEQKDELFSTLTELNEKQAEIDAKIQAFHQEEEAKKQRVFALQEQMQAVQLDVNTLMQKKSANDVERAKIETKQEDLQHELYQELRTGIQPVIARGIEAVPFEEIDQLAADIQKMKYRLNLIGGIDQEVIDEYEETKTRHDGLTTQLKDLTDALNDLERLIDELDAMMKKRRKKAFAQIRKEFTRYFALLFNGGEADLIEIYGEEKIGKKNDDAALEADEEESEEEADISAKKSNKKAKKILKGIDIMACPPGKKIKQLQALSGGERTMTSIALMCAILKTNPSPFVVLDEVEAALDEANTLRVVNIVKELSTVSQFIIITHNRVTMHATDALYGVTMGQNGISKLLSVKMGE